MNQNRRRFIQKIAVASVLGPALHAPLVWGRGSTPVKAIIFDAFPVFDPRPIFGLVKKLFPQRGAQFSVLWRTRIFEYTWLLASAGKYQDFWACIDDALVFTAKQLNITLSPENHARLMNAFLDISAYSDVKPILKKFKADGIKLAFLSNMTEKMLAAAIKNSGLDGYFDHVLSTDQAKTFKPHPRAYQLGLDYSAFASWDAIGAKWFGYPTVWINRLQFNPETIGLLPDRTGKDLSVLRDFVIPEPEIQ